jgi:hypothetical protein
MKLSMPMGSVDQGGLDVGRLARAGKSNSGSRSGPHPAAPGYGGALKDFTASLDLNPARRDSGDVGGWIAVLSKLATAEQSSIRLKSQYEKAQQQNLSLKSSIARIEKQEKELRKAIEDLQALELRMEQRGQRLR